MKKIIIKTFSDFKENQNLKNLFLGNHPNNVCFECINLLIDAKILHLTFNSAVEHLNKFWQNIDKWWLSEMVQENIKIFCEKYAKYEKNIDIKLIKLLKSNLND